MDDPGLEEPRFLTSAHISFAVSCSPPPELDGPIAKDGQQVTRTPAVSWDAIPNVTGGCPSAVL
jgi:hypothetical protein